MLLSHVVGGVDGLHFLFLVLIEVELDVFAGPDPGDLHLVKSEGSGLVSADVSGAAHDFTSSELFDVVIIFKHFTLGVGERDHHSQGEALGDGDDDDGDTNDDVVNPDLEVACEWAVFAGLTTEQVNVALQHSIEEVTEEKDVNSNQSGISSDDTNLGSDELKLLLEGSGLGPHFELLQDFTDS